MEMVDKLYRVRSTKDEFKGHRDVGITWIAMRDDPPLPYAKAIKGLSANVEAANLPAQRAVDELFTREEAEKWVDYLRKHFDYQSTEIVPVSLPLDKNTEGLSYPHGGENLLRPVKEGDPFPFEVCGYYTLPQPEDEG
jgi:hypothetical protein